MLQPRTLWFIKLVDYVVHVYNCLLCKFSQLSAISDSEEFIIMLTAFSLQLEGIVGCVYILSYMAIRIWLYTLIIITVYIKAY